MLVTDLGLNLYYQQALEVPVFDLSLLKAKALVVPENLTVDWLPPYSPQCNPQELVWREVRRHPFGNHDYASMDTVETALEQRLAQLESSPAQIQSLTGFDWIINVRLNAK